MTWLAAPALLAGAYNTIALIAAATWGGRSRLPNPTQPPISILKPIRGRDPNLLDALTSHATQDYPNYEILFGLTDPDDPALTDIRSVIASYPRVPIRTVISANRAPNGKVGVLAALAAEARHPILLVNDSDITVPPDYLRTVVAGLLEPHAGLVTCLYRATGCSFPARWEALGIATEFAPSVLVARMLGVAEFALGSTMVFRAADLQRIGGFEVLADYLADDYQLGARITSLGLRVVFAPTVVETNLGGGNWRDVWKHQIRWSRTIRVSRPAGYYGFIITQASVWALVAACAGAWRIALAVIAIRIAAGIATAAVLADRRSAALCWLIPVRDLWGFVIWCAGLFGSTVEWRGIKLHVHKDGKVG